MEKMTIKKNKSGFLTSAVILSVVFSVFIFGTFINTVSASSCSGRVMTYQEFRSFKYYSNPEIFNTSINISGGTAGFTVTNNTDCILPVSIASYKMYDQVLEHQVLYSGSATRNIDPNSSAYISTSVPNCMAQVDGYFGPYVTGVLTEANGVQSFAATFYQNDGPDSGGYLTASGNFCTNTPAPTPTPTPDATLTGSCSVSPTNTTTGATVSWSASASGGNGSYTYSWSGTDSLYGSNSFVSKTYSTTGTKTGTVTITSGSQSVVKSCSTTVSAVADAALAGSCSVSPSSVTVGGYLNWSATASGGTGSYTYSWSGTDGLYGNSSAVSQAYSSTGTKTGTITITSGTQSVSPSCSANVTSHSVIDDDLSVSCQASDSNIDIDEYVTWHAYASGGDGSYDYSWDGDDSLNGHSHDLSWSYDSSGTKDATITVESDGQTASASCHTHVAEESTDNLSVSCYASPSSAQTGDQINWHVDVSGGDGDYNYDWSGTDGLNSSSKSPHMTYDTAGSKRATVTVEDGNGDSDSDTCYANINSVLAFTSQVNQTPLVSAVYLSQVPYTGLADNMKLYFFIGMLALFSAYLAYVILSYKKNNA